MLDAGAVGRFNGPVRVDWEDSDTMLYALSVGASQDPTDELYLTTENTANHRLKALPTLGIVLGMAVPRPEIGAIDRGNLVHAEQHVEFHRPLPAAGSATVTTSIAEMYDKTSGALVWTESRLVDEATGAPMVTSRSAVFIRGEGGFGGERGSSVDWVPPRSAPDFVRDAEIRPEQALLYRLNGDRNRLHSDPSYAHEAGFGRPILHGLCTFGFTGRLLVGTLAPGQPERLTGMGGRFTAPLWPGDRIVVEIWKDDRDIHFRARRGDGTIVIDRGWARVDPSAES